MNYQNFKISWQNLPVLSSRDMVRRGNFQTMHNQLNNWRAKGLIVQLRRGLYVFGKADRKIEPSSLFLAGLLYAPSYVSLEYALSLYGLIPEMVAEVTSITTKKPVQFKNEFGKFTYQHIKREAFRGFKTAADAAGLTYFMAEPEKALIDFIYLNLAKFKRGDEDIFSQSYRFQNLESLSRKKLAAYAKLYGSAKLRDIIREFCRFIRGELAR